MVNVVDASNLERNLYLTTELLELGLPLVVVLNMSDVARDKGLHIDVAELARRLGAPVVPAVGTPERGHGGHPGRGRRTWRRTSPICPARPTSAGESGPGAATLAATRVDAPPDRVTYAPAVEAALTRLDRHLPGTFYDRWLAVKLLDCDPEALKDIPLPEDRTAIQA